VSAPLRRDDVERARRAKGRSVLLYLTDRCPVGCAHCSVDARRDSARITDFALLAELVDAIAARPEVELVGISGGEPFVERRGLTDAVERLSRAGKQLVVYTSGVWAAPRTPAWVRRVLGDVGCVYLGTDGYHAAMLPDERFVRAARAVRAAGAGLVVQVIRMPAMVRRAEALLARAFGDQWPAEAELSLTPPLPYGRGANVFHRRAETLGRDFGPCPALAAPVVRYDGRVAACCNEQVIVGLGPERLRDRCTTATELDAALERWNRDPLLAAIGRVGPGPLTEHPALRPLADDRFAGVCDVCWRALDRLPAPAARADPILRLVSVLKEE
jgi:hypothetical protein